MQLIPACTLLFTAVAGSSTLRRLHDNCGQRTPDIRADFAAEKAGGVSGFIDWDYYSSNNALAASVKVDLNMNDVDWDDIKEKYEDCAGVNEHNAEWTWHLHAKWTHAHDSGFLDACGPDHTGGHVDPTFACGGASQYKNDPVCTAQKEETDFAYTCNPNAYAANPAQCEMGDFSGKFGRLKASTNKQIDFTAKDYFMAPRSTYNKPTYQAPVVKWSVVFHLVCPNSTPRIFCAKVKEMY